jgi:hypothetical protein
MVEVENRREAEVDAAGAQLGAEHVASGARRVQRTHRAYASTRAAGAAVVHPELAEHAHRRQVGEAVAAKALDATAFVIDADEQVVADRFHLGGKLGELLPVTPVAREEDEAAGERMLEAATVVAVERESGDVEDDWGVRVAHSRSTFSTTTKVDA